MAPKGKAPEKPPEDGKKSEAEEKKPSVLARLKNPKFLWSMVAVFAIISFVTLIITIVLITSLGKEKKSHIDIEMRKLKSRLAVGLKNPLLNYESPKKIAAEVVKLPEYISEADKFLHERKVQYNSIFTKGAKSAGGWKLFGRSLYYISTGQKTWYDAEDFCMSKDAHLASLLSDKEQDYVTSQLREPAWIGLTDENEEGIWEWTDGSRLEAEYWFRGNPRRSLPYGAIENDCTYIMPLPRGQNWKDGSCYDQKRWVCKENLDVRKP